MFLLFIPFDRLEWAKSQICKICTHQNQNATQLLQWVPILTNILDTTVEKMINNTTKNTYRIYLTFNWKINTLRILFFDSSLYYSRLHPVLISGWFQFFSFSFPLCFNKCPAFIRVISIQKSDWISPNDERRQPFMWSVHDQMIVRSAEKHRIFFRMRTRPFTPATK